MSYNIDTKDIIRFNIDIKIKINSVHQKFTNSKEKWRKMERYKVRVD